MATWQIERAAGEARAAQITWLVLDVDGVLTDGRVYLGAQGEVMQAFHVHDGLGLRLWACAGHGTAVISGRVSAAVARRCADLGITHVYQGARDKRAVFEALLRETGTEAQRVCVCGDDLLDVPLMQAAGLAAAVGDAALDVRAAAHLVTERGGGSGAVRELIEVLLRAQQVWSTVTTRYYVDNWNGSSQ